MFGVGISDVGAALGSLNFIGSAARQRGDFGSALVFLALVGSARLFSVILSVGKPAQKGFLSGPWVGDEQSYSFIRTQKYCTESENRGKDLTKTYVQQTKGCVGLVPAVN